MQLTTFEFDHELPPAPNADGELVDQPPRTVTYTVRWVCIPGQRETRWEPGTDPRPELESVLDSDGNEVTDPDVMARADMAMEADFNKEPDEDEFDLDCY